MRSSFNYFYTTTAEDCLDVEDIGNVCLQASNDAGQNWILLIKTKLGFSYILVFIAGAIKTFPLVAITVVESISSLIPQAILPIILAKLTA